VYVVCMGTLACGRGGGETQFGRVDRHCGSLGSYVLCGILCFTFAVSPVGEGGGVLPSAVAPEVPQVFLYLCGLNFFCCDSLFPLWCGPWSPGGALFRLLSPLKEMINITSGRCVKCITPAKPNGNTK
jgi:hypothetical protein